MVGSYCIRRRDSDADEQILSHAEEATDSRGHKYVARVDIKDPNNPKRKWRYFYTQAAYQAYLRKDAKPGDKVQLANGEVGTVGVDVEAPAANTSKTTEKKVRGIEKGNGIIASLFGSDSLLGGLMNATETTRSRGANVISSMFSLLTNYQANKKSDKKSGANNFVDDVYAKARTKSTVDKKTETPAVKTREPVKAASQEEETENGSGGGSGKGSGGGSGKGSGGGSGKGSGASNAKTTNASAFGSISKLPKISGTHDADSDMRAVSGGKHDGNNCVAYDLRRRGYNVTSSDDSGGESIESIAAMYDKCDVATEKDFTKLMAKLSKLKKGARGIMQFGNRMIVWSMESDGLTFRDCTNGKELSSSKVGKHAPFKLIRTDSCSPSSKALDVVLA